MWLVWILKPCICLLRLPLPMYYHFTLYLGIFVLVIFVFSILKIQGMVSLVATRGLSGRSVLPRVAAAVVACWSCRSGRDNCSPLLPLMGLPLWCNKSVIDRGTWFQKQIHFFNTNSFGVIFSTSTSSKRCSCYKSSPKISPLDNKPLVACPLWSCYLTRSEDHKSWNSFSPFSILQKSL